MRFKLHYAWIVAPLFSTLLAACGGSQPAEPAAPAPTPAAAPVPPPSAMPEAPPPVSAEPAPPPAPSASAEPAKPSWDDMTIDQKKEVMKTQVLPQMSALFKGFDEKRFAEVKCATCHGAGAMEGKFTMPNPHLPKLDPKGGFEKHKKKDAKILAFMMEHVSPEMAKIIGEPPYDPATQKGFGCFNCHTMAGK